jgi:hypothetical protein
MALKEPFCFVKNYFLRLTKQVWIWTWVGDRLKIDCQDEKDGFLSIAAYHCCNPHPKIGWNTKLFDFHIARARDCNL